jgi:hypothetical protein
MKIDTAIPPRYRRNLISRHWFVRNTKKRRLDKLKTAVLFVTQANQQRFCCNGSASLRLALSNIYLNCSI